MYISLTAKYHQVLVGIKIQFGFLFIDEAKLHRPVHFYNQLSRGQPLNVRFLQKLYSTKLGDFLNHTSVVKQYIVV